MKTISYLPLFKLLLDRGLKKTDLIELCGLSSATIAKLSKGEEITLTTVVKICNALDCDICDVIELKTTK